MAAARAPKGLHRYFRLAEDLGRDPERSEPATPGCVKSY